MSDPKNAQLRASVKLVCKANNKILLIRAKGKETFNLVGGGVDRGEDLSQATEREFFEETGLRLGQRVPKLLSVEIKQFPVGGAFDGVVNIFYTIDFDDVFDVRLEEGVYEEAKRCSASDLYNLPISEHSNKELLLSLV